MYGNAYSQTDDTQQQVLLPADLLEQVDERLSPQLENRNEFVKAALRHFLTHFNNSTPSRHTPADKIYEDVA